MARVLSVQVLLLSCLAFSCAGCRDSGSTPRPVAIKLTDLGPPKTFTGHAAPNAALELTIRDYHGPSGDFWGAEGESPPSNILWSLAAVVDGQRTDIPAKYRHDLAQVPDGRTITTIEQLSRGALEFAGTKQAYTLAIHAGDGAFAYTVVFRIRQSSHGPVISRTVPHCYADQFSWW